MQISNYENEIQSNTILLKVNSEKEKESVEKIKQLQEIINYSSSLHYYFKKNGENCTLKDIEVILSYNQKINLNEEYENQNLIQCGLKYDCPLDILKYLVNKGVDYNKKDNDNSSVFHHICKYKKYDYVVYFVESLGLNINEENNNKWTPIHFACRFNNYSVVKYLIDKHLEPYIKDQDLYEENKLALNNLLTSKNESILHLAVQNGRDDIINYLVKFIKVDLLDDNKRNAIDYADDEKEKDIKKQSMLEILCKAIDTQIK